MLAIIRRYILLRFKHVKCHIQIVAWNTFKNKLKLIKTPKISVYEETGQLWTWLKRNRYLYKIAPIML